jgi:hypothetical protein
MHGDNIDDFVESPAGDDSENKSHLTPARVDKSVNVPVDEWTDVPKGMVAAPGTYVDDKGVLRSEGDNSCVVWHMGRDKKTGLTMCRRGEPPKVQAEEIIYDVNGAPWCPECYEDREQERERQKIAGMFKADVNPN